METGDVSSLSSIYIQKMIVENGMLLYFEFYFIFRLHK